MNTTELLAPIIRKKNTFILSLVLLTTFILGVFYILPPTEKTTLYFSLKPLMTTNDSYVLSNGIEEGSKVAETIAGWAKNPAFRQEILDEAKVAIPHFKRKLSAQKQNRLNVFWTLSLSGSEAQYSNKIKSALLTVLTRNMQAFNNNNAFPFGYSEPSVFQENRTIPTLWVILIALTGSFLLTFIGFFLIGTLQERLLFPEQITEIFPKSPILKIKHHIGKHDEHIIQYFLSTFASPKLIGLFDEAEKHFTLETLKKLKRDSDSPVILVRLWDTKKEDLENFKALFDDNAAFIVFEK